MRSHFSLRNMISAIFLLLVASRVRGQATIEEVNDRQLEKLTEDNDFVAVAWFTKACK